MPWGNPPEFGAAPSARRRSLSAASYDETLGFRARPVSVTADPAMTDPRNHAAPTGLALELTTQFHHASWPYPRPVSTPIRNIPTAGIEASPRDMKRAHRRVSPIPITALREITKSTSIRPGHTMVASRGRAAATISPTHRTPRSQLQLDRIPGHRPAVSHNDDKGPEEHQWCPQCDPSEDDRNIANRISGEDHQDCHTDRARQHNCDAAVFSPPNHGTSPPNWPNHLHRHEDSLVATMFTAFVCWAAGCVRTFCAQCHWSVGMFPSLTFFSDRPKARAPDSCSHAR